MPPPRMMTFCRHRVCYLEDPKCSGRSIAVSSLIRNMNFRTTRKRYRCILCHLEELRLGGVATTRSMSVPASDTTTPTLGSMNPDRNSGPLSIGVILSAGRTMLPVSGV